MLYKYYLNDEIKVSLFNEAAIVFDTSALLDLYFYSSPTQKYIIDKVFAYFENRLWIPHQVMFEYLSNREQVSVKPTQSYKKLLQKVPDDKDSGHTQKIIEHLDEILNIQKGIKGQLNTLSEKTRKQDKHPYCEDGFFTDIESAGQTFDEAISSYREKVNALVESLNGLSNRREEEIRRAFDEDVILKAINDCFHIGDEFDFGKLMQIVEEGSVRYRENIPPGYGDVGKKIGLRLYGDLILWKQLLKYAAESKKSVIFVCNETKPDWVDKEHGDMPRFELLKEFNSISGQRFWLYNISDFLYEINRILEELEINSEVLLEVQQQQSEKADAASYEETSEYSNDNSTIYKDIDEPMLIDELMRALSCLPFVGLKYFVVDILGGKGYKYESSYKLINRLSAIGRIKFGKVKNPYGIYDTTTIDLY